MLLFITRPIICSSKPHFVQPHVVCPRPALPAFGAPGYWVNDRVEGIIIFLKKTSEREKFDNPAILLYCGLFLRERFFSGSNYVFQVQFLGSFYGRCQFTDSNARGFSLVWIVVIFTYCIPSVLSELGELL